MQKIVYIGVDQLHPHPDNPRKDLGDLTELAESIKAKGVLQNLTVVPAEDGDYLIVIGHRRHVAAKLARLAEVPCVIADMTPQEQFETMMVENVQRSDLTVYEQAEGFQTMLDMGGSVEQVAQKTGFSETTVRSRIKLLALDKKKFQKAEERGGTMSDYLKLNEIRDPEARNRVLDTIGTSNFYSNMKTALDNQKFEEDLAAAIKTMRAADWCKEKTDEDTTYNGGYRMYRDFYRHDQKPIVRPDDTDVATYVFEVRENEIMIWRSGPNPEKKKDPAEERKDVYRKKAEKIYAKLKSLDKVHRELREEFVRNFTQFNNYSMDIDAFAAKALIANSYGTPSTELLGKVSGCPVKKKNYTSELDQEMWNKMLFNHPQLALLSAIYARLEKYNCCYSTSMWDDKVGFSVPKHQKDSTLDLLYEGLCSIGYEMCDDEIQLQNGSHPLFKEVKDLIKEYKGEDKKKGAKKK